jgi:hypothetical protein
MPDQAPADDEHLRNSLRRYETVLGTQPKPLPHVRGSLGGFHIDKLWPEVPFQKEPVPGAAPMQHYPGQPQPVRSLQVNDIEGACPGVVGRAGGPGWPSTRSCNPLAPQYLMPGHSEAPLPSPTTRFLRDSMDWSDLDQRSHAHKSHLFRDENDRRMRTRLVSDDILGATPRQRAVYRDLSFTNTTGIAHIPRAGDSLSCQDINQDGQRLPHDITQSRKNISPLDPQYRYDVPTLDSPISLRPPPDQALRDVVHNTDAMRWHIGPVANREAHRFAHGAIRPMPARETVQS